MAQRKFRIIAPNLAVARPIHNAAAARAARPSSTTRSPTPATPMELHLNLTIKPPTPTLEKHVTIDLSAINSIKNNDSDEFEKNITINVQRYKPTMTHLRPDLCKSHLVF